MAHEFRNIAVLLGGPSVEREVSLVSGAKCAEGLRTAGYRVTELDAGPDLAEKLAALAPDAVFNALHGRWGEDGAVQGMLEWMKLPYTHSGVLASAVAMDKPRAKVLFAEAGLPVAEGLLARPAAISAGHVMAAPYVVKPYNEGSSVGVHIVTEGANSPPRIDPGDAPEWLMVERYIPGRELTVAVRDGEPLGVTEIVTDGWYDYSAKYQSGGSRHVLPAAIPSALSTRCLEVAARAHEVLGCRGVSRADFRYDDSADELVLLEVNTQPGMTPTSLVPEQAAHLGIDFPALVSWMIGDASCDR